MIDHFHLNSMFVACAGAGRVTGDGTRSGMEKPNRKTNAWVKASFPI